MNRAVFQKHEELGKWCPPVMLDPGTIFARSRSMVTVASVAPEAEMIGFDMWVANYAGMENPEPDFVASELQKWDTGDSIQFVAGNSHETLPAFFHQHPNHQFDIITIDGDHTDKGAYRDLRAALPHLAHGGVLDDSNHPDHPNLYAVWEKALCDSKLLIAEAAYHDFGHGIAIAIRK